MTTATIQSRKLHSAEYVTSKLTKQDLEVRAIRSLENIRLGQVYTQQELETISQSW